MSIRGMLLDEACHKSGTLALGLPRIHTVTSFRYIAVTRNFYLPDSYDNKVNPLGFFGTQGPNLKRQGCSGPLLNVWGPLQSAMRKIRLRN